ncbi:HlyD family type I secretion periplasmic adaptor subunit [Ramlibacter solisilvae]|uniref:Membrane fusion protein (MFP) family protein n=1 Tax=Ramlibacter tataouinensis TaxID=94132 RepID=A0A127JVD5_9BURK|nr:HlyD family type I secretion periplasmic adaptor subunit [Ramlibacter tataouinensis]AMO23843.1 secretion protein HlyD [Ramlibacter tataouinensis]
MVNIPFLKSARPEGTELDAAAEEAVLADDGKRATRIGLWALAIGFGGFMLWAAFAPLDEGVAAPGLVSIDTKRKAVQHLTGGIVKEVLVREGQSAKEGQVLIKLDAATARANYEASRQRYLSLRSMQSRLTAEQTSAAKITFHPELIEAAGQDPLIRAQMLTQEQLLAARRGALNADLQSLSEQVQGMEASIQAYTSMIESRSTQLSLLNEELKNTRSLVADGYAPRNRQFELERMVAEANSSLADLQGNILRARRSIGDLKSRAISRQQEFRKETEGQMADVTREALAEVEKFRALQADLARIDIKAPATGQVVGLAVQTPGAVIQPGQKLMDIVPNDEPLLLEARVQPNFIDKVHAGLPVDIRFANFANAPTLVVDGKVLSVSGDLITDPATNQSYFLARVSVTPEGLKKLGKHQMQPGMPTEMIFRTGERSLLTYLLGPLYKRMSASMKEA